MAIFTAQNLSDKPITGTASSMSTPEQAGKYFTKIQCFCFTEQTLKPGQEVRMPVIYFVDPEILDDPEAEDIEQITLSYTFHPIADEAAKALDRAGSGELRGEPKSAGATAGMQQGHETSWPAPRTTIITSCRPTSGR